VTTHWPAFRTAVTLVVILHASASAAAAQVRDTALGSRLVVQRSFRPPFHDTLVVTLATHGIYRIAVWPGRTAVHIQGVANGAVPEFAPRVHEGTGASATAIEVAAVDDGPHAIVVDPPAGTDEVHLWVWEDSDAELRARRRREGRIHVGVTIAAGTSSGYNIGEVLPATRFSYLDAGLLLGSNSRFSVLFGIGNDPRNVGVETVGWAFAEARFRLFTLAVAGHDLDVQFAVRYAQGNSTNIIADPSLVASGLLLSWHLDHRHRTRGFILGVEGTVGRIGNVDAANQRITRLAGSLSWVP